MKASFRTTLRRWAGNLTPIVLMALAVFARGGKANTPPGPCTCLSTLQTGRSVVIAAGGRISSRFSLKRFHPLLHKTLPHYGDDLSAARSTRVLAVGDGVIERAQFNRVLGNFVVLRLNATCTAMYAHLASFAKGIMRGAHVKAGSPIGALGSSGRSTGFHVHYQLSFKALPVDPHCECGTAKTPEPAPVITQAKHRPRCRVQRI